MHRVSPRASLIGLTLAGGLIAAMLIAFMLTMGGQGTPEAQASFSTATPTLGPGTPTLTDTPTPTGTLTPTLTPKPTAIAPPTGDNISGVYDIQFDFSTTGQFNCISRTEEATDLTVKSATTCNADTGGEGIGDLNSEPPAHSGKPTPQGGDGSNGNCGLVTNGINGCLPPPPPYSILAPSKGFGSVSAGGTLTSYSCFRNIGGTADNPVSLGPNVIAKVVIPNFAASMTANGKVHLDLGLANGGAGPGGMLYVKQGSAQCDNPTNPQGIPLFTILPLAFGLDFYAADPGNHLCAAHPCVPAPWRGTGGVVDSMRRISGGAYNVGLHGWPDWDQDGCNDAVELFQNKPGFAGKCGDDAWNPNDPTSGSPMDVTGVWDILATGAEQDACWNNTWAHQGDVNFAIQFNCAGKADGTIVPGAYYGCNAYITSWAAGATPAPSKTLTAKVLCNIDFINVGVNPDNGGAPLCVPSGAAAPTPPLTNLTKRQFCGDGSPGSAPPGCNPDVSTEGAGTPTVVPCSRALPHNGSTPIPTDPPVASPTSVNPHCPTELTGSGAASVVQIYCQPNRWLFVHVNNAATKQTKLTGTLDNLMNTMNLQGCFVEQNVNTTLLGNVYIKAKINAHTGHGLVTIWSEPLANLTTADCLAGNVSGISSTIPLDAVRQAPVLLATGTQANMVAAQWDSDGDGCSNAHELTDVAFGGAIPPASNEGGGLRDPSNRWDFFDPNHDRKHTSLDITAVVQKFGINEWKKDPADPNVNPPVLNTLYDSTYDRSGINSNPWNLGAPNGKITSLDITAAVQSFGQNCLQTIPVNQ